MDGLSVILAYMAGLLTAGVATHVLVLRPLQADLRAEKARTNDLLNRAAARSLEQYAFLASDAEPFPHIPGDEKVEWLYDDTGLIQGESGGQVDG